MQIAPTPFFAVDDPVCFHGVIVEFDWYFVGGEKRLVILIYSEFITIVALQFLPTMNMA